MTKSHGISEDEKRIRNRLAADFLFYAPKVLRILPKPDETGVRKLKPFVFNKAQLYIHEKIEEQRERLGYVRAIILKGRQQGASTYAEGRFFHKTTNNVGQRTFILTHHDQATQNLFAMAQRYYDNCHPQIKPVAGKSNTKELTFPALDSQYQVATAGSKGVGRSATLTNVHASEVAFWVNGSEHLSGLFQAVPLAVGTEIILESTALGTGNIFHEEWVKAETGLSDFIAIFVPWFWQDEYRRPVPDGFELNNEPESVPDGELTEYEYARQYKLDNEQAYWRRMKIIEMGTGDEGFYKFKQEYPATPDEAFQSSSAFSFLSRKFVTKARKSAVATAGSLIIGVDPAGDGENADRFVIVRRRTRRIFSPERLRGLNTQQAARRIHSIIKAERPARVFIDVGGLGKGVYDALAEMPGTQGIVVPVNFGSAAYDSEVYVNRKAEMAWEFKQWLEDEGGANIPDDDDFQGDLLSSVPDEPDRNQRKQLKSKRWMKSKGLKSPDYFDACCLTFAEPVAFVASTSQNGNASTDFDPLSGDISNETFGQIGSSLSDFNPLW